MRLDHIAYRVPNRDETVEHLNKMFGYHVAEEFTIDFDDGSKAECKALIFSPLPEVFVSEGSPGSIVEKWIQNTPNGQGGIHHLAYKVDDIDPIVKQWKDRGIEFLTEDVVDCPDDDLRQIFTKPQPLLGGVIIELIERGDKGFCQNSVKNLMEATEGADK
jgi:4-hydroxyphenylpyruvate dioxygenase-like putative hemolysin